MRARGACGICETELRNDDDDDDDDEEEEAYDCSVPSPIFRRRCPRFVLVMNAGAGGGGGAALLRRTSLLLTVVRKEGLLGVFALGLRRAPRAEAVVRLRLSLETNMFFFEFVFFNILLFARFR